MKGTDNPQTIEALDDIGCNDGYCQWPNRYIGGIDKGLQYTGESWADVVKVQHTGQVKIEGFYSYWTHPTSATGKMKREVCENHFKSLQYWGKSRTPQDWPEEIMTNEYYAKVGAISWRW